MRAVESLKFAVLARLFPKMEDAARLVILRAITTGECLVCGSDTQRRITELKEQLAKGICPICGAAPEEQSNVVPAFKVEEKRVKRARETADLALKEEEASRVMYDDLRAQYEAALEQASAVRDSIRERSLRTRQLSAELPIDAG